MMGGNEPLSLGSLITTFSGPGSAKESPESDSRAPRSATATVLIADNDDDFRQTIAEAIREEGNWNALEARDGVEALRLALSAVPQVLILDQRMPGLTGTEVILELRRHRHPGRIILITAAQDAKTLARENAVDCFLGKPFSIDELLALVTRAIAGEC